MPTPSRPSRASWFGGTPGTPDLLLRTAAGDEIRDPDWPDEVLLDISSPAHRLRLAAIMDRWLADCAAKGHRAVELDNLDSSSVNEIEITDNGRCTRAQACAAREGVVPVVLRDRGVLPRGRPGHHFPDLMTLRLGRTLGADRR